MRILPTPLRLLLVIGIPLAFLATAFAIPPPSDPQYVQNRNNLN